MRPELWQEVLEIWPRVCAQAPRERGAFLDQVCAERAELRAELETLLESDSQAGSFLERPILAEEAATGEADADTAPGGWIGRRLGAFELRQIIGRGGMGTVYLGRRIDGELEQEVAVKIIRGTLRGTALEERFRAERQILARLEHPNIARLIDAGSAPDGSPYEVMEYVRGVPITAYCQREELTVNQRIRLVAKVCEAVETAHGQSIVHRDLKPANILVTDAGEPKLLDFGIAKRLDGAHGGPTVAPMMTPSYASPEQLGERPVTPTSDVYSLGVLLYRLTTGKLPYDWRGKSPVAIERKMLAGPPRRPSEVVSAGFVEEDTRAATRPGAARRALRGDLDKVILKALEAEPTRRYADATELKLDLHRYLERRPVRARPSGWGHRLGKLVSRNRAAAVLIGTLSLALAALAFDHRRQSEAQADQELTAAELQQRSDEMVRFLEETFKEADPYQSSETLAEMQASLEAHTQRVLSEMRSQPALQGRLLGTLGAIHRRLGNQERSAELLERSLELRRSALGPDHPEVALALGEQAALLDMRGRFEAAESKVRQALDIGRKAEPADPLGLAASLNVLGTIMESRGDYERAEAAHREALAIRRAEAESILVGTSLHNLSRVLAIQNRLDLAEAAALESIGLSLDEQGPDSLSAAETRILLADIAERRSDFERADELYRGALATMRPRLGGRHPSVAVALNNRANTLRALNRYEDAEAAYLEALEVHRAAYGELHHEVATTLANLGVLQLSRGRMGEAESYYRQAVATFEQVLGADHPTTAFVSSLLARVRRSLGFPGEAETLARSALAALEENFGREHPRLGTPLWVLAKCRQDQGDFQGAERHLRRALGIYQERNSESPWNNAFILGLVADLRLAEGDLDGAERVYLQIQELMAEAPSSWEGKTQGSLDLSLADLYLRSGRLNEAAPLLRAARSTLPPTVPPEHPVHQVIESVSGLALVAGGERREGLRLLHASRDHLSELLGPRAPLTRQARDRIAVAEAMTIQPSLLPTG